MSLYQEAVKHLMEELASGVAVKPSVLASMASDKSGWKSQSHLTQLIDGLVIAGVLEEVGWGRQAKVKKKAVSSFSSASSAPSSGTNDGELAELKAKVAGGLCELDKMKKEVSNLTITNNQLRTINETLQSDTTKKTVEVYITQKNGETKKVEAGQHACFTKVLQLAAARCNILLVGPAGTGKTHLAAEVAKHLGLSFGHISCSAGMSEGQLTGRLLPVGVNGQFEYVRSEFVRCYEEGGVFLFDELDAADSNTMLVLNSALANGSMALSNRPDNPTAKKHVDFVCIAAANTFGTGADRQYVGRNQVDESTLDRFRIGQVEMDYDAETEAKLCPDVNLRNRLQWYRNTARCASLRRVVSMRFLADAYKMKQAGFTDKDIDQALFCGWSKDELAKMKGYCY